MAFKDVLHFLGQVFNARLFTVSQTDVTLSSIFIFFIILMGVVYLARLLTSRMMEGILEKLQVDEGLRYTLRRITEYILVLLGAMIAFQFIGINLSGLAVIFGLISVGIGFGLQNITANFISGLILLFERPIQVGDRITVGETEGDVLEINIRSTTIRSLNNISIIVPNSEFVSSRVVNWSHGDPKIRIDVAVGVSYNSDLDTVIRCLKEVAEENPEVLKKPAPEVHLREFGDSAWNMVLRIWIRNPKRHYYVQSDINCAIVRKFRQHAVEIPFPQHDVHIRSPLPVPFATEKTETVKHVQKKENNA